MRFEEILAVLAVFGPLESFLGVGPESAPAMLQLVAIILLHARHYRSR